MSDAIKQTLIGVLARLKAYTDLTDIVGTRIYTDPPQEATFPFCLIGLGARDWSAKDFSGFEMTARIQIFDTDKKPDTVLDGQGALIAALDRQESNITITGHDLTLCQKGDLINHSKQPDGKVWQSVTDFNLLVN